MVHLNLRDLDSYPKIIPQAEIAKQALKRNYIVIEWGRRPHLTIVQIVFYAILALSALSMILGHESKFSNLKGLYRAIERA